MPDDYGQPGQRLRLLRHAIRYGMGCPPGIHVRRAYPRDALAPSEEEQAQTLLAAANNHRILRRGRKFGATISDRREDDGVDRGLLFICLNTDIARQFEFVQQTWLLNPNFATLFDEIDPLIGPDGRMTIREEPLRRNRRRRDLRPDGRRRLLLPAEPAGAPLSGARCERCPHLEEVLRPGPQGIKRWMRGREGGDAHSASASFAESARGPIPISPRPMSSPATTMCARCSAPTPASACSL